MNQVRSIFIAGLNRSGTTILDIVLGTHPDCIAVGEVKNVIGPDRDRSWVEDHLKRCSCGECDFWPEVLQSIDSSGALSLEERYRVFVQVFAQRFPDKIPVDSSKRLSALNALSSVSDCKTIRLVRDVRGWCVSRGNQVSPRLMVAWYRANRRLERETQTALSMGYEPLVLDPERALKSLCEGLSLAYDADMLRLKRGTEHILIGNRMRTDRSQRLRYDGRWMQMPSVWPALLRPVMRYNRTQVYACLEGVD
jgi:hypothetical protein